MKKIILKNQIRYYRNNRCIYNIYCPKNSKSEINYQEIIYSIIVLIIIKETKT